MLIRIIPMGKPPQKILDIVLEELKLIFNSKTRQLPEIGVPGASYNRWRNQYNAERLIEELARGPDVKFIDRNIPTVLITEIDMYHNSLNFIFGLQDPDLGCSIVSLSRLRPEFYDHAPNLKVLADRTVKEATHEIGHHLGLKHCHHFRCIMSEAASVEDIDKKDKYFCGGCRFELEKKGIRID